MAGRQSTSSTRQHDTRSGRSAVGGTTDKVRRTASQTAETVSRSVSKTADDYIDSARESADSYVNRGKSQAEDAVRSVGRALEAGCQSLEDDGYPGTAGYVRAAASGLHQAADQVDGFDAKSLTGRAERFVREKPIIAMGGLALAGFVLASIMKAPPRR